MPRIIDPADLASSILDSLEAEFGPPPAAAVAAWEGASTAIANGIVAGILASIDDGDYLRRDGADLVGDTSGGGGGGVTDHGALTGLADDDHSTVYALLGAVGSSRLTMSTNRILLRWSAGTGAIQQGTIGTGLTLDASGDLHLTDPVVTDHGALTGLGDDDHTQYALAGAVGSSRLTMATARMLGRTTASTGAAELIEIDAPLLLAAGHLSIPSGTYAPPSIALHPLVSGSLNVASYIALGYRFLRVVARGAGGGGGSGSCFGAGVGNGAPGGGASAYIERVFDLNDLTSSVAYTLGVSGPGGVAAPTNSSNGNDGTPGTATTFGAYVIAYGGGGGRAGGTAAARAGGSGAGTGGPGLTPSGSSAALGGGPGNSAITSGTHTSETGGTGGHGMAGSASVSTGGSAELGGAGGGGNTGAGTGAEPVGHGGSSLYGAGGGGAGGYDSTAPASVAPGYGGISGALITGSLSGGATPGANSAAGSPTAGSPGAGGSRYRGGGGGGGGGSRRTAGVAAAGGAGGIGGGGGGGGGGSAPGVGAFSGAGGAGGEGSLYLELW